MQDNQWVEIISMLTQLWDKWEMSDAEIAVWEKKLKKYDFRAVKNAVQEYYASDANTRNKPNLSKIINMSYQRNQDYIEKQSTAAAVQTVTQDERMDILVTEADRGNEFAQKLLNQKLNLKNKA